MGNADETNFVIDYDNGPTPGFASDQEVKYDDAVSGSVGMKMVVRISGGRDARIEPPFMVFKMIDVPIPLVGYRTTYLAFRIDQDQGVDGYSCDATVAVRTKSDSCIT